jgi:hypothetical protein
VLVQSGTVSGYRGGAPVAEVAFGTGRMVGDAGGVLQFVGRGRNTPAFLVAERCVLVAHIILELQSNSLCNGVGGLSVQPAWLSA